MNSNLTTTATLLRWTGRIWGAASGLLLLAFAFGGREHLRFTAGEFLGFLLFPVGLIAGFAIAWRREFLGGIIAVTSFLLFCLYLYLGIGRVPGIYFMIFAAPGFLHLASACLTRAKTDEQRTAL